MVEVDKNSPVRAASAGEEEAQVGRCARVGASVARILCEVDPGLRLLLGHVVVIFVTSCPLAVPHVERLKVHEPGPHLAPVAEPTRADLGQPEPGGEATYLSCLFRLLLDHLTNFDL